MSPTNLDTLKAVGVDVDGAVTELLAIQKRQIDGHASSIGGGKGDAPEVTEAQITSVVRRYFTVADTEAVFNNTVAAVKAKLGEAQKAAKK